MPELTPPNAPFLKEGQDRLAKHLGAVPEGKTGALILGIEKNGWNPSIHVGVAARVGKHWSFAGEQTIQKKAKPTTEFYTMFSWG
jgi:hypothetical protein